MMCYGRTKILILAYASQKIESWISNLKSEICNLGGMIR